MGMQALCIKIGRVIENHAAETPTSYPDILEVLEALRHEFTEEFLKESPVKFMLNGKRY